MSKTEVILGYVRRFPDKSASELAKIVRKEKPSLKFSDTLVYDAMKRYCKEQTGIAAFIPLLCETNKAEGMAEQILEQMDSPPHEVDCPPHMAGYIEDLVDACNNVGEIDDAIAILQIIKKGGSK
jgi:hypothetical protein